MSSLPILPIAFLREPLRGCAPFGVQRSSGCREECPVWCCSARVRAATHLAHPIMMSRSSSAVWKTIGQPRAFWSTWPIPTCWPAFTSCQSRFRQIISKCALGSPLPRASRGMAWRFHEPRQGRAPSRLLTRNLAKDRLALGNQRLTQSHLRAPLAPAL